MKPVLEKGVYRVGCTCRNKRLRRSARTSNEKAALRLQDKIDERLEQLLNGAIALPAGVSARRFLLYGQTVPGAEEIAGTVTMQELRRAFMAAQVPPKVSPAYLETLQFYDAHFGRFLETHPDLPERPDEWTYQQIEEYRRWRLSEPKGENRQERRKRGKRKARKPRPYTVAKELAFLGRMFRFGHRRGWVRENPLDKVESIPDTKPETAYRTVTEAYHVLERGDLKPAERKLVLAQRYFLLEEIDEFLDLVWRRSGQASVERPDDIAMILTIAAWTGMRFGEIAKLDRLDVDLNLGVITTRSRKQSRTRTQVLRHIPIVEELKPRLQTWLQRHPERLLFGPKVGSDNFRDAFYRGLDRMTRGTKFQKVRPHMLRHSMRSNLTMAGEDERRIDEILGHTTEETRQRYRHIQLMRLKASMNVLERSLEQHRRNLATPEDVSTGDTDTPPDPSEGFRFSLIG